MKGYYKIIPIDLYCRDILFVFGDEPFFRKAVRKYHTPEQTDKIIETADIDEHSTGKTIYNQVHNAFIVWMPRLPQTTAELGTLSHEIFHATQALMINIGANLSEDSEEAYAYLIGYITKSVFEQFPICSFCENGQVLESAQNRQEYEPAKELQNLSEELVKQ